MAEFTSKQGFSQYRPLASETATSVFLYASLGIFFLSVAGFGGLLLLNKAQREARDTLIQEVKDKEQELRSEFLSEIFLLEQRLKNIRRKIAGRSYTSQLFGFLEKNALPQVRFLSFNYDNDQRKINMGAEANSFTTVSRQVNILERHPGVEKVDFGGLAKGKDSTSFQLTILLKSSLLTLQP